MFFTSLESSHKAKRSMYFFFSFRYEVNVISQGKTFTAPTSSLTHYQNQFKKPQTCIRGQLSQKMQLPYSFASFPQRCYGSQAKIQPDLLSFFFCFCVFFLLGSTTASYNSVLLNNFLVLSFKLMFPGIKNLLFKNFVFCFSTIFLCVFCFLSDIRLILKVFYFYRLFCELRVLRLQRPSVSG